ncbi:MATE family efflux transporter [Entomospira entomophila]|uniref:Multidrug-efflux transporter n=1 Tax=Entomospira entomophila TaxID=2719988 RepID=A0A968KQX1_9SPIO|nr:MATE family efflux transporter [Entomospira entomophilus]NIZ40138.1 MATE family efflux transporter [Entomospira entomophilus]WDI35696.1 MATE family efflux transporter [Entomospira entomophilus]
MIRTSENGLNRSFFKQILLIGVPISIQNLAQASVGFIDTAMVAQLGEITLGAVGLSQQINFFLIIAILGLASGGGVLITRYWGANQIDAIRSITAMTTFFSVIVSSIIAIISFIYAEPILFALSSGNSAISETGAVYLKIISLGFPITAVTISLAIQLRCVNKSQYPMYMSLISLPTAILFNYILIYGKFGFPALGVAGAAIGTLLTRIFELFLTIMFFGSLKNPVWNGSWRSFTAIFKMDTRRYVTNAFLKLALPITAMELLWVIGQSFYKFSYAYLGVDSLAAYTVYENIINLFNAGFIGLGNTAAILIGQEIGRKRIPQAVALARNFIKTNFLLLIPTGLFLIYISPAIVSLFAMNHVASHYLHITIIAAGSSLSFKSLNFLLMTGILRSGGDARFIAIITAIAMTLAIIATYFFIFIYQQNFYWILTISILEESLRNLIAYRRYRSNRWLKHEDNIPITSIT